MKVTKQCRITATSPSVTSVSSSLLISCWTTSSCLSSLVLLTFCLIEA